jgi:hypothetical protein
MRDEARESEFKETVRFSLPLIPIDLMVEISALAAETKLRGNGPSKELRPMTDDAFHSTRVPT